MTNVGKKVTNPEDLYCYLKCHLLVSFLLCHCLPQGNECCSPGALLRSIYLILQRVWRLIHPICAPTNSSSLISVSFKHITRLLFAYSSTWSAFCANPTGSKFFSMLCIDANRRQPSFEWWILLRILSLTSHWIWKCRPGNDPGQWQAVQQNFKLWQLSTC